MKKILLDESLRIALREHSTHPEFKHYLHWTFIVQDKKIIEWATNRNDGVPPISLGYHRRINDGLPKLHSEYLAYNKAKGIIDRNKNWSIINIRLNKHKQFRISAPCSCCATLLKDLGCTKCYFTINFGWAKTNV